MKNTKLFPVFLLATLIMLVLFTGCDDSGLVKIKPIAPRPTIEFKPGAVYYFTVDTISFSGLQGTTTWLTASTVHPPTQFECKTCYPIISMTTDTLNNVILQTDTEYFYYDPYTYKFYQYGVKQFFDSNQTPSWDPVADFSQIPGTKVFMFNITFSGIEFQVSSTVENPIVIPTTSDPSSSVYCFKINVIAESTSIKNSIAALEYFIGYTVSSAPNNPIGRIRIRVPSNIQNVPRFPGVEQKLNRFSVPWISGVVEEGTFGLAKKILHHQT